MVLHVGIVIIINPSLKGDYQMKTFVNWNPYAKLIALIGEKNEESGYYEYVEDDWDNDESYSIYCRISDNQSYVEYYIDEMEGLYIPIIGCVVLVFVAFILIVWGVGLVIITIVRRCTKGENYSTMIEKNKLER